MGVHPKFEYEAEHCIQLSPEEEERKLAEYEEETKQEWPKYINVYTITQEYGGPEEGGWWFDSGEPIESIRCDNQEQFDIATLIVEERYAVKDRNKWSRERKAGAHSCMPGAHSITIRAEEQFAAPFPSHRPHYE